MWEEHKQQEQPQPWEDCRTKLVQEYGRDSWGAGAAAGVRVLRATKHRQIQDMDYNCQSPAVNHREGLRCLISAEGKQGWMEVYTVSDGLRSHVLCCCCYYQVPAQNQKILEHLMLPSADKLREELRQQPLAQMFGLVLKKNSLTIWVWLFKLNNLNKVLDHLVLYWDWSHILHKLQSVFMEK